MHKQAPVLFLVLAAFLLLATTFSGIAEAQARKGKLTVAMVNPLSGDGTYGVSHKNGLEMAFAEINKAGGVKGQEIELVTDDDAGYPGAGGRRRPKIRRPEKCSLPSPEASPSFQHPSHDSHQDRARFRIRWSPPARPN